MTPTRRGVLATAPMRVLLVDDHPLVQEIMRAVLERALKPSAVYVERDLDSALRQARRLRRLELVVLDLGLPGCSKLEALARFRAEFPSLPVVVLSASDDAGVIRAAIAAGAKGYIPKTSSTGLMQSVLRVVPAGGTYIPPEALRDIPNAAEGAGKGAAAVPVALAGLGLSERQVEVLKRIARGLPNRQIADELAISENTVKHHAHEVFRALGVATRSEAILAVMRNGLRFD